MSADAFSRPSPPPHAEDTVAFNRSAWSLLASRGLELAALQGAAQRADPSGNLWANMRRTFRSNGHPLRREALEIILEACEVDAEDRHQWIRRYRSSLRKPVDPDAPVGTPVRPARGDAAVTDASMQMLATYLFTAFGSPHISGYSRAQVMAILTGQEQIDDRFVEALLRACTGERPSPPDAKTIEEILRPGLSGAPITDTGGTIRSVLVQFGHTLNAEQWTRPRAKERDRALPVPGSWHVYTTAVSPASAGELAEKVNQVLEPGGPPRPAPPDPGTAADALEFVKAMNELKDWSGLSLRKLSDTAKEQGDWNLARSSLSDALKSSDLPRRELLWAFTAAAGLSREQRECWMAARERLDALAQAAGSDPTDGLTDDPDHVVTTSAQGLEPEADRSRRRSFTSWWKRQRGNRGTNV